MRATLACEPCPAESGPGAAIEYAVNVKGAVVIVAAGNTGQDCTQNPPPDPAIPADPRGWKRVQTTVTPAWYSPLVLTVGGIGQNGQPSAFSMSGPWVGAAAPAENIAALGYDGAPVNALQGRVGPIPSRVRPLRRLTCRVSRRCSSSGSPT